MASKTTLEKELRFLQMLEERLEWAEGKPFEYVLANPDDLPLLKKLAKDGILTERPNYTGIPVDGSADELPKRLITISDNFHAYVTTKRGLLQQIHKLPAQNQKVLWVDYNDDARNIVLNGAFLLSTPRYESVNQKVFSYLFHRANRLVTPKELWDALKLEPKHLANIAYELNFKEGLYKLFFDCAKVGVTFHNPVTQERLDNVGIKPIRLFSGKIRKEHDADTSD